MYELTNIRKNYYSLKNENNCIMFKITHDFDNDWTINIKDRNMSSDNVIFINKIFPTPEKDLTAIIGTAYLYDNKICIAESLVSATVISSTNMSLTKAKDIIESFFN